MKFDNLKAENEDIKKQVEDEVLIDTAKGY